MEALLLKSDSHRLEINTSTVKQYPPGKYYECAYWRMHGLINLSARIAPNGYNADDHYKGHVSIYISLDQMPIQLKKIRFRYHLKYHKDDVMQDWSGTAEWGNSGAQIGNSKFCTSKELFAGNIWSNLDFTMQILALFDSEGKEIGVEEQKMSAAESASASNKSLEARLEKMAQQIESIQRDILLLRQHNKVPSNDAAGLKQWLTEQVALPEYVDTFIKNGIDNLDVAKLVTMDVLKEIGIKSVGHRMRLLHYANKL